jgi:hypothetical protein
MNTKPERKVCHGADREKLLVRIRTSSSNSEIVKDIVVPTCRQAKGVSKTGASLSPLPPLGQAARKRLSEVSA